MITPTLETDRILLRPLKVSDAEDIFNNWTSDPEVAKYMRWNTHQSVDVTAEWLTAAEINIASNKHYDWGFVLKKTGEIFGSGGIFYNEEQRMFELGYVIMKKYWRNRLTTEAGKAIVDFAVNVLNQKELFARHAKENPASGRVMEKLGFIYRNDGEFSSFDESRIFNSKEYIFITNAAV